MFLASEDRIVNTLDLSAYLYIDTGKGSCARSPSHDESHRRDHSEYFFNIHTVGYPI